MTSPGTRSHHAGFPPAPDDADSMNPFLEQVAAATGYTIDWSAAADHTSDPDSRALRRWLRLGAALIATDLHRTLLLDEWTARKDAEAANGFDNDLGDIAPTVHAITCDWLRTDQEWATLLAGFQHLGEHLGILHRADPAAHNDDHNAGNHSHPAPPQATAAD